MRVSRKKTIFYLVEIVLLVLVSIFIVVYARDYREEKRQNAVDNNGENEGKEKVFDLWYSYTGYEEYLKEVAARYEEKTGIKVRLTYYTTIDYLDKISSANASGNGPDLYLMSEESLQNAVLLGIAEQNINSGEYNSKEYTSKANEAITFVDKQYGYPLGFETTVFAANTVYVDAMPVTFDEVKSFADNFNNEEDTTHDYSSVTSILKWDISDIFYSYGFLGGYLNVGGEKGDNPTIIDVKNDNAVKAGEYYYSLAQYFYTDANSAKYSNIITDFASGKIIYTIASADIIKIIEEQELSVQLSVLPNLTDDLESKSISVTDMLMVNPFGDMKEEAREFSKMASHDMAEEMYQICGIIAARDIEYENNNINIFLDAYNKSVAMPKLMTTSDYWLKIGNVLTNIWNGSNVSETLSELYEELDTRIN